MQKSAGTEILHSLIKSNKVILYFTLKYKNLSSAFFAYNQSFIKYLA